MGALPTDRQVPTGVFAVGTACVQRQESWGRSDFINTKYVSSEASSMISGSKPWTHPDRGSRCLCLHHLPDMPGWAWSKPCCGTWLPEGLALG